MTYEAETIIPLKIGFPTLRTNSFTPSNNDELLAKSLDLIEERRENTIHGPVSLLLTQARVSV